MKRENFDRRTFLKLAGTGAVGFASGIPVAKAHIDEQVEPQELFTIDKIAKKEIAVIGSGIAGLSAGWLLQEAGAKVTVYESGSFVGGRMSSFELEGRIVDRGAQIFPDTYPTLIPLLHRVGLQKEIIDVYPNALIPREGTPRKMRFTRALRVENLLNMLGDPNGLLKARDLPLARTLYGLESMLAKTHHHNRSDITDWIDMDTDTSLGWAQRFLNKKTSTAGHDYFAEPFVSGLSFQDTSKTSQVLLFWIMLFFHRANSMKTLRGGMGQLPKRLAKLMEGPIHLNTPVRSVRQNGSSVEVTTDGDTKTFDGVIVATTSSVTRSIMDDLHKPERELLERSTYRSVTNTAFVTKRKWRDLPAYRDISFLVAPKREREDIYSFTQDFRDKSTSGKDLFQVFAPRPIHKSSSDIQALMADEMESLYIPKFSREIEEAKTIRIEEATPDHYVGKSRVVKNYREFASDRDRKVLFAGDYCGFYGTDGAAATGIWAAKTLARHLRK